MSKPINITTAVTLNISQFVSGSYASITGQNNPVGQTTANTSSYATVNLTTGSRAVTSAFWKFDCSSIPSNATINSVSCQAGAYVNSTNSNRVATRQINLYSAANSGSTKGTAQTVTNTTNGSVLTIPGGTWTRSQLDNCYVGLYGVRGTNSTGSTYYFRLYGAELTVNYTVNETAYEVNVTNNSTIATVSPTYFSGETGENATLTFTGAQNKSEIVVKDNNVDVTNSLVAGGGGFQYTISNISTDHTIVVTDGNVTKYAVNATSSYAGATVSPSTQQVAQGRSAAVSIDVGHTYEIIVKDNGTVVQVPEPQDSTVIAFGTDSYISTASTYSSLYSNSYPTSNGENSNSASTTYCRPYANTGANAESRLVYSFDCSSIPSNAVIESVSCYVKGRVGSTSYLTTRYAQLYCGDTAKGSRSTTFTASDAVQTISDGGTWTRSELDDIRVAMVVRRGTSNTTTNADFRFHGATLLVTYSVPCTYVINNVQSAHTVTVEEAPYSTITISSSYAGATISASPTKVYNGQNSIITVSVQNIYEVKIKDGNTDITSNFTGTNGTYSYTLQNVQANHSITVEEAPYSTISTSSSYAGATVSANPTKVYNGRSSTITVSVQNLYEINITDNGVNIKNSLVDSNGTYTYTLTNVQTAHTISVTEATYYNLVASSSHDTATISPATMKVYQGQNAVFTINGTVSNLILKDNGIDVTSSISNGTYTITNVTAVHTLTLLNKPADYIRIDGSYRKVGKVFKKIDGVWVEINKTAFDDFVSTNIMMYGGDIRIEEIGSVETVGEIVNISINNNALSTGTYKLVYEDEHREPLDNVDKITEFTI